MLTKKTPVIPKAIRQTLPPFVRTKAALADSFIDVPAGTSIVRAARSEELVWPTQVNHTYRFGPPPQLRADGRFPFHWIYVGLDVTTCVWEGQLCQNDSTRPGTFYMPAAAAYILIARMRFECPLRLLNLAGEAASKLGIFDQLASPDHQWCQWFGCQLDQIILESDGAIDGIHYLSRRHPGNSAFALSSRSMAKLDTFRKTAVTKSQHTKEFVLLRNDPCFVSTP